MFRARRRIRVRVTGGRRTDSSGVWYTYLVAPFASPRPARIGILFRALPQRIGFKRIKGAGFARAAQGAEGAGPVARSADSDRHGDRARTRGEKRLRGFQSGVASRASSRM